MDKSTGNFHTAKEKEKMTNIFKGLFFIPLPIFSCMHEEIQTIKAFCLSKGCPRDKAGDEERYLQ